DRLNRSGYMIERQNVRLMSTEPNAQLAARIAASVRAPVEQQRLDHAYYDGIRFMIDVRAPDGGVFPLIDGGAFNWLRKLCSNEKLVYVASGVGAQLIAYLFPRS